MIYGARIRTRFASAGTDKAPAVQYEALHTCDLMSVSARRARRSLNGLRKTPLRLQREDQIGALDRLARAGTNPRRFA
jgi:hypothetical protein